MKKRNPILAAYKLIFCLLIIIMHSNIPYQENRIFYGATIFVEFFFIFQGYCMYKGIEETTSGDPSHIAFQYMVGRIKRFFPCLLFMSILCILIDIYQRSSFNGHLLFPLTFARISFLSLTTPYLSQYASFTWFLSASVLSGGFVMYLLHRFNPPEKDFILIPFIVMLITNYILSQKGDMDDWRLFYGNILNHGLVRAFSAILLGVFCKYIKLNIASDKITQPGKIFLAAISIGTGIVCIREVFFYPRSSYDFVYILLFCIIILCADLSDFTVRHPLVHLIDSITMPLYIFQRFFLSIKFLGFYDDPIKKVLFVLTADILLSVLWVQIEKKLLKK